MCKPIFEEAAALEARLIAIRLQVCLHRFGSLGGIFGDDDGEGDVVRLAEFIAPQHEVLNLGDGRVLDELIEAVDKDMTDVKIAGMKAADKAL